MASEPIDPDDFDDDLKEPEITLDDFPDRSIAQYAAENPAILFDACASVAEDDPGTWGEIVEHAQGNITAKAFAAGFESMGLYDQEEAWALLVEIAKRRRLPLADLL